MSIAKRDNTADMTAHSPERALTLTAMSAQNLFICPRCGYPVHPEFGQWRCTRESCRYADSPFPIVAGIPALVDFEHSVLDADRLRAVEGASEIDRSRYHRALTRLLHPANTCAPVNVARMLGLLRADATAIGRRPRILVIGGGSVGSGLDALYADSTVDLICFDIYASPAVQFIADGHAIPLADESVDGVVIQAVLEHVLEPTRIAHEIQRVLRNAGIVYADTPFLQQVHEGPYDFTRFTDSGHRYLFRHFERIDSGAVAGAGTALRWSIAYFARALTRSARFGQIMALCFFWLSYADRILDPKHSLDGASSVFFLGRKAAKPITAAEIIDYYQGGM
ncbi:methyltransferase domain-containing protein [Mycobacterium sp. M1]|uniref:Methyltransferase domain-containing protein n=1 Tax=Mycolicibacter acidiphilus TaxID=2835306 RepID=A0ABS5RIV6_9MYCO|nr:methyltransferase domain-containing protein [Mycolicibacter acidiphilus]MBS9533513.1 methyltransferase domain-containing protein [Mycolicibacter acidiphilus]